MHDRLARTGWVVLVLALTFAGWRLALDLGAATAWFNRANALDRYLWLRTRWESLAPLVIPASAVAVLGIRACATRRAPGNAPEEAGSAPSWADLSLWVAAAVAPLSLWSALAMPPHAAGSGALEVLLSGAALCGRLGGALFLAATIGTTLAWRRRHASTTPWFLALSLGSSLALLGDVMQRLLPSLQPPRFLVPVAPDLTSPVVLLAPHLPGLVLAALCATWTPWRHGPALRGHDTRETAGPGAADRPWLAGWAVGSALAAVVWAWRIAAMRLGDATALPHVQEQATAWRLIAACGLAGAFLAVTALLARRRRPRLTINCVAAAGVAQALMLLVLLGNGFWKWFTQTWDEAVPAANRLLPLVLLPCLAAATWRRLRAAPARAQLAD